MLTWKNVEASKASVLYIYIDYIYIYIYIDYKNGILTIK